MARFRPGVSGNPSGRPRGTGHAHLRAQIVEALPEILSKLIEDAKKGDSRAARLLLERALPSLGPEDPVVMLTAIPDEARAQAVVTEMFEGRLSPRQAASVLSALGLSGKAFAALPNQEKERPLVISWACGAPVSDG